MKLSVMQEATIRKGRRRGTSEYVKKIGLWLHHELNSFIDARRDVDKGSRTREERRVMDRDSSPSSSVAMRKVPSKSLLTEMEGSPTRTWLCIRTVAILLSLDFKKIT